MQSFSETTKSTRGLLTALAVVSVLLLSAGCAAEPENSLSAGGGGGSGGASDQSGDESDGSDEGSDSDGGSDSGDSADSGDAASLTGAECIPGVWTLDNEVFAKLMSGISDGFDVTVAGTATLTFRSDGTTTKEYDHWTNTMNVNGGTVIVERNGVDLGTYSVTGESTLSTSETTIGSTTSMSYEDGSTGGTMARDTGTTDFAQGEFTCSGDTLSVTADGGTSLLHRKG